MVSVSKRVTVECIDCERAFELSFQPVEGQIVTCPHCDAQLEVISEQPLEFDFYYEEWEDDWDDDDDEDWEDDEDDEDWEDDEDYD